MIAALVDPLRVVTAMCSSPDRGPCTDAERRAATLLHDALRGQGTTAWLEPDWVRPQWAGALALGAALAVAGSLVSVGASLVGLVMAAVAAVLLAVEALGYAGPLRWAFVRRATQSVVVEPQGDAGVALLVCARTDAPRKGLMFALPFAGSVRWIAAAAAVLATVTAALRLGDLDGTWLGAIQFVPTVVLLLVLAGAIDAALGEVSPGANDSASACAAALAVHAELLRTPPAMLAPGLVLHGAGEGDPLALRRLLRRERRGPADTVILDVGPAGVGAPAYATRHPQLERAAARAAEAVRTTRLKRGAPRLRRLPILHVSARIEGRVPHSRSAADTPDRVRAESIDAVVDLALAAVDALDADLAAAERP